MNRYLVKLICLLILASGCDIKKSDVAPNNNFMRVYDDGDFSASYYPLDMVQTADNGFLILAGIKLDTAASLWKQSPYLMKTDDNGIKIWETRLNLPYVSPIPGILKSKDTYYTVCMDNLTLETQVLQIDLNSGNTSLYKTLPVKYPLYAYITSNNDFIILSFDVVTRKSSITTYDANFTEQWQSNLDIVEDVRYQIIDHLNKTGLTFPFFIGELKENELVTGYYVNCFINYTLSLVFLDVANGSTKGLLNGFQTDGAVSSAVFLDNDTFAISRFSFGDNYILPKLYIDINTITSVKDLAGSLIPELSDDAKFISDRVRLRNKDVIVYVSDTKDSQIALYFFESGTTKLLSSKYFSDSNPIEVSSFVKTTKGGLAVLTRTFVVGRFPRISLFKIAPEQLGF